MSRDTEIWGEDASEFKPSRWIDENGELIRPSQYKFHAFNAGPRLCLGMFSSFPGCFLSGVAD